MRITAVLLLAATLQISAKTYAQRVNLRVKNAPLQEVITQLRQQTGFAFFWNQEQVDRMNPISADIRNASLKEAMEQCLNGSEMSFSISENNKAVYLRKKVTAASKNVLEVVPPELVTVTGKITNEKGEPLPGAVVVVQHTSKGTAADGEGRFSLVNVPEDGMLVIRLVGYEPIVYSLKGRKDLQNIVFQMKIASQQISEVTVSTGIFTRKKESFTGSYAVYTGQQLKTVGNQNIIQSLRTLDPSMLVLENNLAGSNPNAMPNLAIQGKTSMIGQTDALKNDPNQPLFILDGFESDLQTIVGLDINRVASITILKDAASTAIYGSKGANGVVVVETKLPNPGAMNLMVTSDNTIQMPDLRDYNMMSAAQLLEYQRIAGVYTSKDMNVQEGMDNIYNKRLTDVQRGRNTYWLGKPLQKSAWSQNYSVYAEGGDTKFRYGLGLKYGNVDGVMKGSGRQTGNGSIDVVYKTGKLSFTNKMLLTTIKGTESPYGSFTAFVKGMPYYEASNNKYLDSTKDNFYNQWQRVSNPMYQAMLPNRDESRSMQITDRFSAFYQLNKNIRFDARIGLTQNNDETEYLRSPLNAEFDAVDVTQKGKFVHGRTRTFSYEGYLQGSYGAVFNDRHEVNFVPGFTVNSNTNTSDSYTAVGFPASSFLTPSFGTAYPAGGYPSYAKAVSRSTSFFANAHYGYDRRYMVDFTYRNDGSSVFGINRRFTSTWTFGAAWNLHNEAFLKHSAYINYLQIRASVGNPGNQNFGSYNSFSTLSFIGGALNDYGTGMMVSTWGNSNLAWQKTINKTVGFDARLLNSRLNMTLNVYDKLTDPLVVALNTAPSVGMTSQVLNMGNSRTRGLDFTVNATVLSKPDQRMYWRVNASGSHYKSVYGGIGNKLSQFNSSSEAAGSNDSIIHTSSGGNLALQRYYDGASPDDIWAVRSLGIDPANGREVFLTKDGQRTYDYRAADAVRIGNSQPSMQGVIGTSFQLKGFSLGINMRYMLNSWQLNSAVYNKVENVTLWQSMTENLDARALTGRWQKPGDQAQYKGITITGTTPISSRFIQKENALTGESFSFGYDLMGAPWLKRVGMNSLRLTGYMNDIFRLSTITRERGIDYPYARSVSFTVSASF
ncbi:TonB-linked SusC/RagA family outer membrane protein [Chitinophaga dinghuensis]|uniref:TonB-linked SusC/RagA family outer membrane protein n=1 Tax=Chitinophaga dinghuensis TaxID=1539050 RepID=A0A327W855_9BACT|nr:SusC/RagA family TonB-linked outer membrane protein [Chitinophaga dinghuensis]RAJ82218.1 TonB-linked SusC/RagA family outer membrane protein [Chitinophaga dinghuensis]